MILAAPRWPERILPRALTALAFAVPFFLFRDRTHLLGDGRLWLAVLREKPIGHPHEPLAFLGARLAALFAGSPAEVPLRVETWNVLLGCVALFLAMGLTGRIATGRRGRWMSLGLFLSMGLLQFAFGYVEAYGLLTVAVLLFLVAGIDALAGRAPMWLAALSFGFAVGVHGSAVLFFPALLVVALRSPGPRRWASVAAALLPIALAYLVVNPLLAGGGGGGFDGLARGWSELFRDVRFHTGGFSAWVLEPLNRGFLTAGAALTLGVAGAVSGRLSKGRDGEPPVPLLLGIAAVALCLPALLLDMDGSRGSAADWDAFAVAALPLWALASWMWLRRDDAKPPVRSAIAVALVVAFFSTGTFIAVNASSAAAVARFEFLASWTFRTARARSWAHESLALYRRDQGDMARAADEYVAAVSLQPKNVRLLRNAAGTLSRAGRSREAARTLGLLTQVEPGDFGAWLHLGMERDQAGEPDSALVAFRRALELNPESLDAMNETARLLMRRPEGREEARALIKKSLEMAPGQEHAAEMKRALGRMEESKE